MLHQNYVHYRIENFVAHGNSDYSIEKEYRNIVKTLQGNTLLITLFWDPVDPEIWIDSIIKLLTKIKHQHPTVNIVFFMNEWYSHFDWSSIKNLIAEFIFIDFFLVKTYVLLENKKLNPVSSKWDSNSSRFSFLTGKSDRIHRIRLLYKLANAGVMDHAIWSFFVTNTSRGFARMFLPELSDAEFEEFVKKYNHSPDNPELIKLFDRTGYTGIPFDPEIYSKSLFAIIPETLFDDTVGHAFLTEKVWLRIANRLPFIMAGLHRTVKLLNSKGYNTFQEFLPVPNYDDPDAEDYLNFRTEQDQIKYILGSDGFRIYYESTRAPTWPTFDQLTDEFLEQHQDLLLTYREPILSDSEQRLNHLVYNTKYWLDNLSKHSNAVEKLVEQNRNIYLQQGQQELQRIGQVFEKYKILIDPVDFILSQSTNETMIT